MDLNKIERVYTSYAGFYDRIFGKVFHEGRESVVRNLDVQPDEHILEVGVGTGLALPMYPRHCRIVGIDFSEGMLAKAKEKAEAHRLDHVQLHRMDAGAMEFQDDSFDTVVAAYVVTAVPDYRKVVNEMIRVCRPGGRIIMLNHFSNGNKVIAAVEKVLSPITKHLGWRTDLSLNTVLEGTSLHVARNQKVNPLRLWALVECVNRKNDHGFVNGNGAGHGTAVYPNGNGSTAYSNGNGRSRYSHEPAS
ncbi:MAG: methyltransferase domain-containing protein [Nitrospira sp.]|nr:methyltransferase domain-containing protein [Nitrospira sp.]MBH0186711.1 methyltransferase domain-containing protein [Nitrospira sp.]MBH0188418.1 methyltransferase domain-containing protein [Nitrospira sp.]MBH0196981.1 methyltransferase domain-containing protein [Nitrospira sp.]